MCSPLLYVIFPQVGQGWGQPFQVGPFYPEQATAAMQTALQIGTAIPGAVAAVTYALTPGNAGIFNQWVPLANFILPKLPGVNLQQIASEGLKGGSLPAQETTARLAKIKAQQKTAQEGGYSSPWRFFNFTFGAQCVTGGSMPQQIYPVSALSFASFEEAAAAATTLVAQMGGILPRQVFYAYTYATDGKQWVFMKFSRYWDNPILCEDGKPWNWGK